MAHELIHTCRDCFNHGKLFQTYTYIINKFFNYNIELKNSNKQFTNIIKNNYKYKLTCLKCDKIFYSNRLIKKYGNYLHNIDNEQIKVEQLY